MVHELADVPEGPARLDSVRVAFDEERLISDAGLMLASLMPDVTVAFAKEPASGPRLVKGVGEAPTTGVPPAAVRSLEKIIGKRLRKTPLTPEEMARRDGSARNALDAGPLGAA